MEHAHLARKQSNGGMGARLNSDGDAPPQLKKTMTSTCRRTRRIGASSREPLGAAGASATSLAAIGGRDESMAKNGRSRTRSPCPRPSRGGRTAAIRHCVRPSSSMATGASLSASHAESVPAGEIVDSGTGRNETAKNAASDKSRSASRGATDCPPPRSMAVLDGRRIARSTLRNEPRLGKRRVLLREGSGR